MRIPYVSEIKVKYWKYEVVVCGIIEHVRDVIVYSTTPSSDIYV